MSSTEKEMIQKIITTNNYFDQKEFYDKYKKIVKDYLNTKYPNNGEIDDDVSEIMIKVFFGLKSYDSTKTKLKTWVINVAKNHMIDKWRANKNIEKINIIDINIDSSSSFIDDFENTNVLNCLSSMINPVDYNILNLKYFYGYELKEIEDQFNMNSGDAWGKIKKIKYKIQKNKSALFL